MEKNVNPLRSDSSRSIAWPSGLWFNHHFSLVRNRMRIALLAMLLLLSGCSNFVGTVNGKPEVIYTSNEVPPTKIQRQTSVNRYKVWFTPEGSRVVNGSYDHHHYILNPDQTTVDLPFLDSFGLPSATGEGVFAKIFAINNGSAWVALGAMFKEVRMGYSHDSGWFDHGNWQRDLTVKVFVKTFTRKSLIRETIIEVCNPSNAANPTIQFDESVPAIRFRSMEGTKIYLPLTGEISTEYATPHCSETMSASRTWETYYEQKSIGTP